jgi:hypothetical protein
MSILIFSTSKRHGPTHGKHCLSASSGAILPATFQLCPDDPLADYLTRKAAQYHEKAFRIEFEAELDQGECEWVQSGHG